MKPLAKSGGLVDFKEGLAFKEYKDTEIRSARFFKEQIHQKYNLDLAKCSKLYIDIINYQIKTYGEALRKNTGIIKAKGHNSVQREKSRERALRKYHTEALIERVERNESKRIK